MSGVLRFVFTSLLACLSIDSLKASNAKIATDWNAEILEIADSEDAFTTLKGLRTVTLMHLAMHDALNSRTSKYARYSSIQPEFEGSGHGPEPSSRNLSGNMSGNGPKKVPENVPSNQRGSAIAVHAAYYVATSFYPDHAARLEVLRDQQLAHLLELSRPNATKSHGAAIAAAVIKSRRGDGWDTDAEYNWHPMAPGVYAEFNEHSGTPEGFVFGAGWAQARGFGFSEAEYFRVAPPPSIDSDAYTQAFNEVKAIGRFQSIRRTADQTHIALWWKDFVENSHNRLARDLIEQESIELIDAVRLLALLNTSIFDAYIASFNNKFHFNHWRPYTAIRWADNDGNDATLAESTWTNTHQHTYAFPSYPSAHGTACAAAMTIMESVFGKNYAFTMSTPLVDRAGPFSGKIEMQPSTRSFAAFSDAADQCAESRVFLGIHFRYDAVTGVTLGRRVGENTLKRLLNPSAFNPAAYR
ncbi:MAG: vanadium-dependent haloperoxidase [Pseudomonadota bacterium]